MRTVSIVILLLAGAVASYGQSFNRFVADKQALRSRFVSGKVVQKNRLSERQQKEYLRFLKDEKEQVRIMSGDDGIAVPATKKAPDPENEKRVALEEKDLDARIPSGRPTEYSRISSGFGERKHPILGIEHFHRGVDMAAAEGTPVRATAAGVVTYARFNENGYGNFVKINHKNGYKTAYAHLSSIRVACGDRVGKGDVVGYVGSTGLSTGPHLHYEVYYEDRLMDPSDFL